MLITIISVLIGNLMFFALWILFAGFTSIKTMEALDDNPKGAKARESSRFQSCNDPDCECSARDCD